MNRTILTSLFGLVIFSMVMASYQSASISSDSKLDRDLIYDLITSEADAIYDRLKNHVEINSRLYQQQLAENEGQLVSSSEVSRPKRGRRNYYI